MQQESDKKSDWFLPYLLEIQIHQYMEALSDSLRLALGGGDKAAMAEVGQRIRKIREYYNEVAARNGLPDLETALRNRSRDEGCDEIPF